jgi:hypothetical protein
LSRDRRYREASRLKPLLQGSCIRLEDGASSDKGRLARHGYAALHRAQVVVSRRLLPCRQTR